MNEILLPVLIVAGIGLLCGLGLAIASIVMAVPKDEKAEAIGEDRPRKCRGCSKCVEACPKEPHQLRAPQKAGCGALSNCDKGRDTMKVCTIGCIGCLKCVKTCEFEAVAVKKTAVRQ